MAMPGSAQPLSPAAETSVTIAGKAITIKYSAPSVRGRKVFTPDGILTKDSTYPVWRAGANAATLLDSAADLTIGGLTVPAGKHTLYVLLDKGGWKLIVNKQTGQSGMMYDEKQDLGRVAMTMGKPAAFVEKYKMTLASTGGNKGRLTLEWENTSASVDFTVK
ncbi:MAG: DUF2911 domain-containing protein [Acidobacteriota bacterium]|nr:DUF2911 domain-containing protein [Acidobacteriota bacterium]